MQDRCCEEELHVFDEDECIKCGYIRIHSWETEQLHRYEQEAKC